MHRRTFKNGSLQVSQQFSTGGQEVFNRLGVIADKPKYPQYAPIQRRLDSFKEWPAHLHQKPNDLAEAGFAYTGVEDAVRCYHCGNGLRHWELDDCPWRQHAFHFRQCGHVRMCKGEDYIRQVHGETSIELETDGDCDDYMDSEEARLNCLRHANDVSLQAAKEFDMEDDKIETALKYFLKKGVEIFSGSDLISTIEKIENGEITCETDSTSRNNESKHYSDIYDNKSKHYSDIKDENESLKEPLTCKICYDSQACIVTIPCGHMVTCPQCIGPLLKCCLCRAPIEGKVRAFLSDGQ